MSIDAKEIQVKVLCQRYHQLIGPDHHKDRDCHFFISKRWSYGQWPTYEIEHNGYLMERQPELLLEYDTYESARDGLIDMLTRAIAAETERRDDKGFFKE